jgi:hypothetical protein
MFYYLFRKSIYACLGKIWVHDRMTGTRRILENSLIEGERGNLAEVDAAIQSGLDLDDEALHTHEDRYCVI